MGHEFPLKYKSGLLAFLSVACLCLMCGCPRQVEPPLLSGGESSDFNHSLESFLEVTPESEHTAIIHSILFLVVGEMDPTYYTGKSLGDLLKLPIPEVLKFELFGKGTEGIFQLAQQRFLENRATLNLEQKDMQEQLEKFRLQAQDQSRQEKLLDGLLVRDFSVRYEKAPFKVLAFLDFQVVNQSVAPLTGLVFRVDFKGLSQGAPDGSTEKRKTFSEALLPGSSRSFKLVASECPKIPHKIPADYPNLLQTTVKVINGSLPTGEPILSAIPDMSLDKKVKQAEERLAEVNRLLEVSSSGNAFLFWRRIRTN